MHWESAARQLAAHTTVRPESRWLEPMATTPRHHFVPRWWTRSSGSDGQPVWNLRDGAADPEQWVRDIYSDTTLVTRVGRHHADHAQPGQFLARQADRYATSSSTLPSLVLLMYRSACIADTSRVLVTTGSGYGTALACSRLGDGQVTSVDVDPYLVSASQQRLAAIGHHPRVEVCDLTKTLPDGSYDRIVSTVAVPTVPTAWLDALAPGGRLVTTIARTGLIIIADKKADGGATGYVGSEPAGFMSARYGEDYDNFLPDDSQEWQHAWHAEGETTTGRFPLTYVPDTWDVRSTLELLLPGIEHRQHTTDDGVRTVLMLHEDGSWARAAAPTRRELPTVHQGGPRRLWDELDRIRTWLVIDGDLPIRGAAVTITAKGAVTFSRKGWSATIG
ncbi:methyltransferase domain-containing protein [Streptomyces noursei]|uniref:methyltransferase domain-containing protein n=1 Tax=Streptomyces noursei TaxID=1971 RepID=UPI001677A571|nr:methyltransferase domain-containing protein [Streptomyces noursei]MCZ1021353.1 methyltransferase domain-containing protein [Streptomyces noursei]GGX51903.1 SAM-dependent methyltransferase [Streptomyces noursei]